MPRRALSARARVFEGDVSSLKHDKDDVREVQKGFECGIGLKDFDDFKVGDILEFFATELSKPRARAAGFVAAPSARFPCQTLSGKSASPTGCSRKPPFCCQEMNDPRLDLVTITQVNIDRELEYANVFVSTVGDEARRKEVMHVLNGARGYIRREIAKRVQLRRAPEINFHWDPTPEKAEHIARILDEIKTEAPPAAGTRRRPSRESADDAAAES